MMKNQHLYFKILLIVGLMMLSVGLVFFYMPKDVKKPVVFTKTPVLSIHFDRTPEPTIEPIEEIAPEVTLSIESEPTPEPTVIYQPIYEPTPTTCSMIDPLTMKVTYAPCEIMTLHRPILLNREEVKTFMLFDDTDKLYWYNDSFQCGSFSASVKSNADKWNEECHMVSVYFMAPDGGHWGHSVLRFPTIEDGDVYVDATQGDWFVHMEYGDGAYYRTNMVTGESNSYMTLYGVWEDFR